MQHRLEIKCCKFCGDNHDGPSSVAELHSEDKVDIHSICGSVIAHSRPGVDVGLPDLSASDNV